jgi:hypothetical protein
MKNVIAVMFLSMLAGSAFAQHVSASAVAQDVSSPYINGSEVSAPSVDSSEVSSPDVAASVGTLNCCAVSVSAHALAGKVSIPQGEDDSGSLAMAGLGFGLVSLVGVTKLARRKSKKSEGSGIA